jgi:hypothetical protein
MQATDFEPFAGHFSPCRAKNDLQKKRSTMLPQAKGTFCISPTNNSFDKFAARIHWFHEGKSTTRRSIMSTRCPELASIRKVIDLYIDGVQNGNLEAMVQAFHPQSSMFGYKGKDLFITPIQGLYDYIAGTTPPAKAGAVGKAYTCTITSISVVGNAASVEMAMDGYHEHDFTDFFQLLKVDGRWWIVSKLFHADPQG